MDVKPILYISPLPPPYGGIATWTALIFKHGLPKPLPLTLVDTRIRGRRNVFERVSFSLPELIRLSKIVSHYLYQLLFHRPGLIHLSCSLSTAGIFRDYFIAKLANVFNIPLIAHFHGNLPDFRRDKFKGLSGRYLRRLMNLADVNIVENIFSLNYANTLNISSKIVLVPNFVEDSLFNKGSVDKRSTSGKTNIIFAGGITKAKGIELILQLAMSLPEACFHLYGKIHEDMIPSLDSKPPNIILHGAVDHADLLNAMRLSDILLFPSHTEGFPLTVVEAMAMALPVVASKVGAIPEMIEEGRGGFLCAPADFEGFLNAIKKISTNAQLKIEMGNYNQRKAYAEYRYSKVMLDVQTIYLQLSTEYTQCVE